MNLLSMFVSFLFAAMFGMAPQPTEITTPEEFVDCLKAGRMAVFMSYQPDQSKAPELLQICTTVQPMDAK